MSMRGLFEGPALRQALEESCERLGRILQGARRRGEDISTSPLGGRGSRELLPLPFTSGIQARRLSGGGKARMLDA